MKILVLPVILFAVSASGQQKEKKLLIPHDTTKYKKSYFPDKEMKPSDPQRKIYKMPSAKPDESVYSSLKDKRKDTTDYKMLNSIIPEKDSDNK
ncbi:hypothetical protein [Chryseobacterium sp. PET-29]|uniref:hypothetical protein n=1 Tax=Chryseobacterium sp. PET-29 TaxID=2983267 RepID=UPI0021E561D4|nr:hypothetical protein [Chryseobacterium sp. PET-29]